MPAAVRTALGAAPIRALPARYDTQPEFRYAAGDLELLVLPGMTEPPPTGETAVVTSCAHRDAWWLVRKRRRR
jgi:hypothetical protein